MDDDLEPKAKLPKVAKVVATEGFAVSHYSFQFSVICTVCSGQDFGYDKEHRRRIQRRRTRTTIITRPTTVIRPTERTTTTTDDGN